MAAEMEHVPPPPTPHGRGQQGSQAEVWGRGSGAGPRPQEAGCRQLKAQKKKLQDSQAIVKGQVML